VFGAVAYEGMFWGIHLTHLNAARKIAHELQNFPHIRSQFV